MTPEDQLQFDKLKQEIDNLKQLLLKDEYSNLKVFRKQVEFKNDIIVTKVDISNINDLNQTGGTAVIADGNHTVNIGVGGGSITIVTKNGIVTSIT
jgi:hypothetical protein